MSMSIEDVFKFHFDKKLDLTPPKRTYPTDDPVCPHSGQVQNDESKSSDGSDLFTISTDKTLAKPPDNPVLNRWDTHTYAWHQDGKRLRVSEFQITATIWIDETQRRTAWLVLDEIKSPGATRFVADASAGRHVHAPIRPEGGTVQ